MFAADADRQRQHRDDGEAGRLAKRADGVAHVLPQRFERMERPHVPALLLQIRDVAEAPPRRIAGVRRRDAVVSIVGLAHREVERELVVQVALEPPAAEERDQPMPRGKECVHVV